jgi:hypothetical protein
MKRIWAQSFSAIASIRPLIRDCHNSTIINFRNSNYMITNASNYDSIAFNSFLQYNKVFLKLKEVKKEIEYMK